MVKTKKCLHIATEIARVHVNLLLDIVETEVSHGCCRKNQIRHYCHEPSLVIAALLIFMLFFGEELMEAEEGGSALAPFFAHFHWQYHSRSDHLTARLAPD